MALTCQSLKDPAFSGLVAVGLSRDVNIKWGGWGRGLETRLSGRLGLDDDSL
jgi:hypothetical protein